MPAARLDALLAHEVSVHLLTHFNGAAQGLSIFRTGLAGYEGVQEGLGVFAEWAAAGSPARGCGCSPPGSLGRGDVEGRDLHRRLPRAHPHSRLFIERRIRDRGPGVPFRRARQGRDLPQGLPGGDRAGARRVRRSSPSGSARSRVRHAPAIEELLQRGLVHAPRFTPLFLSRRGRHRPASPALRRREVSETLLSRSLACADRLFHQRPGARACGLHDDRARPPGDGSAVTVSAI